jgi:hypothetical protein
MHIPDKASHRAAISRTADTRQTFGNPAAIQLAHDGRVNIRAPLLKALSVLCLQVVKLLSVLLRKQSDFMKPD